MRNQSQVVSVKSLVDRLGLDYELSGHNGCVNCIEWNKDGSILASGSDDFHVMLWDPFRRKNLAAIDTGHRGNIFSVKVHTLLSQRCVEKSYISLQNYSLCPVQWMVWLPVGLVMVK